MLISVYVVMCVLNFAALAMVYLFHYRINYIYAFCDKQVPFQNDFYPMVQMTLLGLVPLIHLGSMAIVFAIYLQDILRYTPYLQNHNGGATRTDLYVYRTYAKFFRKFFKNIHIAAS